MEIGVVTLPAWKYLTEVREPRISSQKDLAAWCASVKLPPQALLRVYYDGRIECETGKEVRVLSGPSSTEPELQSLILAAWDRACNHASHKEPPSARMTLSRYLAMRSLSTPMSIPFGEDGPLAYLNILQDPMVEVRYDGTVRFEHAPTAVLATRDGPTDMLKTLEAAVFWWRAKATAEDSGPSVHFGPSFQPFHGVGQAGASGGGGAGGGSAFSTVNGQTVLVGESQTAGPPPPVQSAVVYPPGTKIEDVIGRQAMPENGHVAPQEPEVILPTGEVLP